MIIRALVLVLAAVLMVACSPSDAAITGVVKSKLATDSKAEATAIDVDTEDGVVTLKGTTHDPEAKEQAL